MAFTFPPWIDRSARICAVVGTGFLLIATSAVPADPQICLHETEQIHLLVEGTCGPSTTITIVSHEDECPIAVLNGTAAELPNAGRFGAFEGTRVVSLRKDPWTISGYLLPDQPDGGGSALDTMGDAALASDADEADAGADAGAGGSPDALFVPGSGAAVPSPSERRHCKVLFELGVPKTLECHSVAQVVAGTPTCTSTLVELSAR